MTMIEEILEMEDKIAEFRKSNPVCFLKVRGVPIHNYKTRLLPGRNKAWDKEARKEISLDRPYLLKFVNKGYEMNFPEPHPYIIYRWSYEGAGDLDCAADETLPVAKLTRLFWLIRGNVKTFLFNWWWYR
jgi:hypothetical protein